ncbi:MAG: hypothetical protein EBZ49_00625 [Proteobacteria bacterium]|nr:hypothetical protein [Pseudomonadota bacterium]
MIAFLLAAFLSGQNVCQWRACTRYPNNRIDCPRGFETGSYEEFLEKFEHYLELGKIVQVSCTVSDRTAQSI